MSRPACPLLLLHLLASSAMAAQQTTMSRAFDLERRGDYGGAAQAYREVLNAQPGQTAALLGLERVLLPLNRATEIIPDARAAMAANPRAGPIYGVAIRAWAAAGELDSVHAVADRWAAQAPGDETPYREWGAAALAQQNRAEALAAYRRGRERLGGPDALAAEMAQLALTAGDYPTALREWLAAVRRLPGYRVSAVTTLAQAPEGERSGLLARLGRESDLPARRIEAELRARWGDPEGAFRTLEAALPADDAKIAIEALRGLLDQLRPLPGGGARLAQARTLEALADRSLGAERARYRLDAARLYTSAGDRDAARRMLTALANDREAPAAVSAGAASTLVQVLIGEGKLGEAARRLGESRSTLPAADYASLQRQLVLAFLQAGDLDRADSALGPDSTIEGLALSGRIHLYRGDIAGAVERFRLAGPFAGDRSEATQRTTWLALLQPIEPESLPALGRSLLRLAQGDTARAISGLAEVAHGLPAAKGGAEVNLMAGRLAARSGRPDEAERLLRAAASPEAPGTAPAAELALAELWLDQRRPSDAVAQLEHLILTYPGSALVPQARRRLDEARGAVPQT